MLNVPTPREIRRMWAYERPYLPRGFSTSEHVSRRYLVESDEPTIRQILRRKYWLLWLAWA